MKRKRQAGQPGSKALVRAGWIFLFAAIAVAIAAIIILAPAKGLHINLWSPSGESSGSPSDGTSSSGGSEVLGDTGGKSITIDGILCDFTPPVSLTFGVMKSVDLASLADAVSANVQTTGWGELTYTLSEDGSLVLYPKSASVLPADKFDTQTEFLKSSQPEALARTFLSDSGLYSLLLEYGIRLSLNPENNNGEILFSGSSDSTESESQVRLNFLYDGSLNQAKVTAAYLADPVTTEDVTPLADAAKNAVCWTSNDAAPTQVTAAEIRYIQGVPMYVLTCADGATAYALAVSRDALAAYPEVLAVYDKMMLSGIQEYVRAAGAGY